jgi:hypothetical protein
MSLGFASRIFYVSLDETFLQPRAQLPSPAPLYLVHVALAGIVGRRGPSRAVEGRRESLRGSAGGGQGKRWLLARCIIESSREREAPEFSGMLREIVRKA